MFTHIVEGLRRGDVGNWPPVRALSISTLLKLFTLTITITITITISLLLLLLLLLLLVLFFLKLFTLLDLCVSSLRRGHANLLCIVPILTDDPRRESN